MNVELISYTPNALELLLYTKNTRLQGEQTLEDIMAWPEAKKYEHLDYMRNTIKSSWEFVDYIFEISGVSRAFTHQLVRTRQASYAQQTQRAVNLSASNWVTPTHWKDKYGVDTIDVYDDFMAQSIEHYSVLINEGMEIQDARGVIPTNIETNIIMKANLRTLHQMAEIRLCTKTQGEYQEIFREMRSVVVEVHPWAEDFIQVFCVNHGSCCFPNFTECPIQKFTYNADSFAHVQVKNEIKKHHAALIGKDAFSANPVVKDAKTDG